MITIHNYKQKRDQLNFDDVSDQLMQAFKGVDDVYDDLIEFYTDANPENDGIREVVDNHIKLVNKHMVDDEKPKAKESKKPKVQKEKKSLDEILKEKFKNYSDKKLLTRLNKLQVEEKNDDDELYELNRRAKAKGFALIRNGYDKLEIEKKKSSIKNETIEEVMLNSPNFRQLVPRHQQMAVDSDELIPKVKELEKQLAAIPGMYHDEDTPSMQHTVHAHYFYGGTDIFVLERGDDALFAFTILNGDHQMAELGYQSIMELTGSRKIELDFYWKKRTLGEALNRVDSEYWPIEKPKKTTPKKSTQKKTAPKPKKTNAKKPVKKKVKNISTKVDKDNVDRYSDIFKLLRRFKNFISKDKVTFRQAQLLFMAFNKAAVERKVRAKDENSDLFDKANEAIVKIFDIAESNYDKAKKYGLEIELSKPGKFDDIMAFTNSKQIDISIRLLKRFISLQGTKPDEAKAKRLLKAIENAIKKDKLEKNNRLYKDVVEAKKELASYIKSPNEPIDVDAQGLTGTCDNRLKCEGITKDGQLKKGYKFTDGGKIEKVKKKAKSKKKVKKD